MNVQYHWTRGTIGSDYIFNNEMKNKKVPCHKNSSKIQSEIQETETKLISLAYMTSVFIVILHHTLTVIFSTMSISHTYLLQDYS